MNPLGPNVRKDLTINIDSSRNVMAGAGSKGNQYGMEWNGGEDYTVVGFLGQGAFASVVKLATKREGRLLAGKQIEKRKFVKNGVVDRKIKNEMHIMKDLEHVSCEDNEPTSKTKFCIAAAYCQIHQA